MVCHSRDEGPKRVPMTWRAMGLAGTVRHVIDAIHLNKKGFKMRWIKRRATGLAGTDLVLHVIGCRSTQETRDQTSKRVVNDVA